MTALSTESGRRPRGARSAPTVSMMGIATRQGRAHGSTPAPPSRLRRVGAAAALALALVLTGCAAADREPTAPDGLTQPDKRGAAAAAAYFATLRQATLSTGDTHTWREHTDPSCRACTDWANLIDAVYYAGGSFGTNGWTIMQTHVTALDASDGTATVAVIAKVGRVDVYDIYGKPYHTDPAARVNTRIELVFFEGRWRVMSWQTITSLLEGAPWSTTQ